jgi:hypothetical protein
LIGVGVFAGGPYYCAQGSLTNAESTCLFLGAEIDTSSLISAAQGFASSGYIDNLANLNGQPVYLYSGELDTVVQRSVVTKLQDMYQQVAPNSAINTEYSILSEHCLPTLDFGNICLLLESPYVSKVSEEITFKLIKCLRRKLPCTTLEILFIYPPLSLQNPLLPFHLLFHLHSATTMVPEMLFKPSTTTPWLPLELITPPTCKH